MVAVAAVVGIVVVFVSLLGLDYKILLWIHNLLSFFEKLLIIFLLESVEQSSTIINSISNSVNSNNQLITTVNGVASAPVNLPRTDEQSLSLAGNTLSISNGNSVTLPSYIDTPQLLSQSENTITLSNGGGSFTLPTFNDTDAQSLALNGNTLSFPQF